MKIPKEAQVMKKPKFEIGQTVYNKVSRRGSFEPSMCQPFTQLTISEVKNSGKSYTYVCGYNGYTFDESELMSVDEYKKSL